MGLFVLMWSMNVTNLVALRCSTPKIWGGGGVGRQNPPSLRLWDGVKRLGFFRFNPFITDKMLESPTRLNNVITPYTCIPQRTLCSTNKHLLAVPTLLLLTQVYKWVPGRMRTLSVIWFGMCDCLCLLHLARMLSRELRRCTMSAGLILNPVNGGINPLKTIWFCYNTHFP